VSREQPACGFFMQGINEVKLLTSSQRNAQRDINFLYFCGGKTAELSHSSGQGASGGSKKISFLLNFYVDKFIIIWYIYFTGG